MMTARLPKGVTGLVHYSGGTSISETRDWVEVTGTTGVLSFAPDTSEMTLDTREGKSTVRVGAARGGVVGMVREFRDSLVEDREPIMSGREALNDLAVVLAAYRSARGGTVVKVAKP